MINEKDDNSDKRGVIITHAVKRSLPLSTIFSIILKLDNYFYAFARDTDFYTKLDLFKVPYLDLIVDE